MRNTDQPSYTSLAHQVVQAAPEPLPADLMAEIVRWSQHTHVGQSEAAALLLRVLAALRDGGDQ